MKKRLLLILTLTVAFAVLLCACAEEKAAHRVEPTAAFESTAQMAQTSKEESQSGDEDAQDMVVARVNGTDILYREFAEQMASVEAIYSAMTDALSADEINLQLTEQAQTVLENLISQVILEQKAEEYDIALTAEQEAEVASAWEQMQERFSRTISANYPTLEGEDLAAMVLLALESSGIEEEMITQSARSSALIENLRARFDAETAEPTQAELQALYDTLLLEQQTEFENDAAAFETAILGGEVVVYIPDEYRVLHEWEFRYEDDVIALLKQLEELDTESSTAYEDTLAAEQARTLQTISMVQALLASGSEFDTLYENANSGKAPRVNYIAAGSSRFSDAYYEAAMQIPAEGSAAAQPIAQNYGYTLLYWADTLAPGAISLYDVEEALAEQLLREARNENWKNVQAQWREQAEVFIDEALITYG